MTRREIFKYGAIAGGVALLSTKGPIQRSLADGPPQSPPTTPFRDALPFPPPPIPVAAFADLDPNAAADAASTGGIATYYHLVAEQRDVFFHKDFEDRNLKTSIWGYRDANVPQTDPHTAFALGPTFRGEINSGIAVRLTNNLDPNSKGFGYPYLTTHLHGGHQPYRWDGFATHIPFNGTTFDPVVPPGGHYDYIYPLRDPGFLSDPANVETAARPATLWYHDHLLDFTAQNVYKGLAGFFRVFDEVDTGDDSRFQSPSLSLPYGDHSQFDIPLVFQDKIFASDASIIYDPFDHNGLLGDKYLVNGKIQPYLDVQGHRYRFRLLNGSNARFYQLFLTNSAGESFPLTVIATEGGLLSYAISQPSLLMSPALRFDVIIDFSKFRPGEKLYLENRLAQTNGRGPEGTFEEPGTLPTGTRLMEFRVGDAVSDFSQDIQPGTKLRHFDAITKEQIQAVTKFREFDVDRSHGAWTINGELAGDLTRVAATTRINVPEIWRLKNRSGGWWHPQHIHSEFFRVLNRNGGTAALVERDGVTRKETVILGPNDYVDVYVNFRDYAGPFVTHCHNAEHEDGAMMARFDVAPSPGVPSI